MEKSIKASIRKSLEGLTLEQMLEVKSKTLEGVEEVLDSFIEEFKEVRKGDIINYRDSRGFIVYIKKDDIVVDTVAGLIINNVKDLEYIRNEVGKRVFKLII